MWQLNLPEYQFRLKQTEKGYFVLDNLRKRFVKLTPEEWVRQNFLRFLTDNKHFPSALIAVEKQLTMNGMKKRCDAILYDIQANPVMIIEFKAPNITINQQVFDQVAVYNAKLKVNYFLISNGLEHFCCKLNVENASYSFFEGIPEYEDFCSLTLQEKGESL